MHFSIHFYFPHYRISLISSFFDIFLHFFCDFILFSCLRRFILSLSYLRIGRTPEICSSFQADVLRRPACLCQRQRHAHHGFSISFSVDHHCSKHKTRLHCIQSSRSAVNPCHTHRPDNAQAAQRINSPPKPYRHCC